METNQLFNDLIVIKNDSPEGADVYISCTELCDWLKVEANKMVEQGLNLLERANNKFLNDEDRDTYIEAGLKFETYVDMGKMIADSALNVVGSALVNTVDTIEDMGFTDE